MRVSTVQVTHADIPTRQSSPAARMSSPQRRVDLHGCGDSRVSTLAVRVSTVLMCVALRRACRPCPCVCRLFAAHVDLADARVDPSQHISALIVRVSTVQSRIPTSRRGDRAWPRACRPLRRELIFMGAGAARVNHCGASVNCAHLRVGSWLRVSTLLMRVSTTRNAGRP